MLKQICLLAVTAAMTAAMPAHGTNPQVAIGSGQYSIGISGIVPVICRASVDATIVAPSTGEVSLGSLNEFCNSPGGYEVYADYSPAFAGASLMVDGASVTLSDTGSTRISASATAAINARSLTLDLPDGVIGGNISFRIVAL
jgi:hypothetical protein